MPPLDQQRERIQDDIRGLIAGEVRCNDVFLQLFASDASIYEVKPLGVIRPRSAADVSACVRYAAEKRIPIHARGAGTGVAGESLGPGLILDFSAHLRRVIRLDPERVRVQPGVVYERLNEALRPLGRVLGPDPASGQVTTVGSMIAIDAAGSRWLKYGSMRRHVQSLQVVLADGEVLEVGREPLADGASASTIPRKRDLVNRLAALLTKNAELIRRHQPNTPQNHCGYDLIDILADGQIDLARLLVGSEGTLALITEATLRTEPLPRHRGVAVILFDSVEKAARAVPDVVASGPTACDLMDRRHLSLARAAEAAFRSVDPLGDRGRTAGRARRRGSVGSARPAASFGQRTMAAEADGLRRAASVRGRRDGAVSGVWSTRCSRCCIERRGRTVRCRSSKTWRFRPACFPISWCGCRTC